MSHPSSQCCIKCKTAFPPGSKITEFDGKLFHPQCFACASCREPIIEQFFPVKDGDYMLRVCANRKSCHVSKFPRQICTICKKQIDSAGLSFNNNSYHANCFKCKSCQRPLPPQSKIRLVSGAPCCTNCYEHKYAKKCQYCTKTISGDLEYLEYEDNFWHKSCFKCAKCCRCIADESFYRDNESILCKDCI